MLIRLTVTFLWKSTLVFLLSGFLLLLKVIIPPFNFPRTIPTVPFYVIFLPSIFDMDQVDMFNTYLREPLEKYGAVKMFFGSRWNILVSRPEYLAQIFKDETTFAKSGNQKKIPYSVIAAYTGDNIISAHGKVWKTYRHIMSDGLQNFNGQPFEKNAKRFCKLIQKRLKEKEMGQEEEKSSLNNNYLPLLIQRLALDNISQVVLGFDFGTLEDKYNPLHQHLIRIKKQIFHPLFLTFPFFDLLHLPQRQMAFEDVKSFRKVLVERVRKEMIDNYNFEQTSFVVNDLIKAYNNDSIDYQQLTDNIVILLVAGHENPQLLITTCLYLLSKFYDTWQILIWNEIKDIECINKLKEAPLLSAFVYEAVRMYPPLNTIINRKTIQKCRLGENIIIPKDTYVGYNNFGATHSSKNWGPTADLFDPLRWGGTIEEINKEWKQRKNDCSLSSFHGGRRACLGEKLALIEVKVTIREILKRYQIKLAKDWNEKMTPGGPLCPANLKLEFVEREK
ncbi:cytochrome P450-Dit2p [Monosporozyma unispora]|nr:cytochrome P450-dit2 [Kazachstania unispora]